MAVIYARYSSRGQNEQSIDGQLRECKEYARRKGYKIIREYIDEALTGTSDKRPAFQRMIKDSNKKRFETVLVWKLDRFARNRYDSAVYKQRLKKNGVSVVSAMENIAEGAEGIIMEGLMEAMAEYYSANLSENVKRGNFDSASKCKTLGVKVFGYSRSSEDKFVINPEQANVVRYIFEQYTGRNTIRSIVDHLNEKGVKTERNLKWSTAKVSRLLSNEKYIGIYKYGNVEIPGGMPRIIDDDLWNTVCSLRKKRKHTSVIKIDHEYLLSNKCHCGMCGALMFGEYALNKRKKPYFYYVCSKHKEEHACKKKREKQAEIESVVINKLVEVINDDEMIDRMADQVVETAKKEASDTSVIDQLELQLKEVDRKLENIATAIEEGIFTKTTKSRLTSLEKDKAELEISIEREKLNTAPLITKDQALFWLESFRDHKISSDRFERSLIDTFLNAVYVYDDKYVIAINCFAQDKVIEFEQIKKLEHLDQQEFERDLNGWPNDTPLEHILFANTYVIATAYKYF